MGKPEGRLEQHLPARTGHRLAIAFSGYPVSLSSQTGRLGEEARDLSRRLVFFCLAAVPHGLLNQELTDGIQKLGDVQRFGERPTGAQVFSRGEVGAGSHPPGT